MADETHTQAYPPGPEPLDQACQAPLAGLALQGLQLYNRGEYFAARRWLDPLPNQCQGVQVAQLRQDARRAQAVLKSLGREHIADFDRVLFRPIIFCNPS
jgi:hypothetical protein